MLSKINESQKNQRPNVLSDMQILTHNKGWVGGKNRSSLDKTKGRAGDVAQAVARSTGMCAARVRSSALSTTYQQRCCVRRELKNKY